MPEHIASGLSVTESDFRAQAVYSDETKQFRFPPEPLSADAVEISIRVGKGTFSAVFLCTEEREYLMEKGETEGIFEYFKTTLPPTEKKITYYFRLQYGDEVGYYTKYGYFDEFKNEGEFQILRDYQTPDWAKGAVMYQIYPDRFCNGDPTNDVRTNEYVYLKRMAEHVKNWDTLPTATDVNHFYGGDLQGVIDKLDYLEDLGVEVLYFNPIFVSPSNHKYDAQDYHHIDPHLGKIVIDGGKVLSSCATNNTGATMYATRTTREENLTASDKLFAQLVEKAHERGIKVLVDGVFNHCGAFHKWLDREGFYKGTVKGAYHHKDSPYRDYFYWNEDGSYEGWWGYENHPKLNEEGCEELKNEILEIGKKWVSAPFHADGWRLDVAADLGKTPEFNHKFWSEFRKAVKKVSPDKLILAEHYGDASSWLQGDQWDSIMNYDAFMEPVTWFLTGVSKHSTEKRDDMYNNADVFWGTMSYQMGKLPSQAIATAMNELSNHDHSRFLTRTNRHIGRLQTEGSAAASNDIDPAVFREAVLLQMTWNGAPTVYYGDEAGLEGWTDPDNRRTYPWGREEKELIAFHKEAIYLRKENPVLRHGSLKQLYGDYGVIAYGRFDREEKFLIVLNNTDESKSISVPVWQAGMKLEGSLENCLMTNRDGFTDFAFQCPVKNGFAELTMPPKSAAAWKEVE
ncbi:glycoside hydrolase family 13 protein [Anaerotignum sp.]